MQFDRFGQITKNTLLALFASAFIAACGGGGGSDNTPPVPPPPPPPPPTTGELIEASKFASRATFGLSYDEIDALARQGRDAWLNQQFAEPVGEHTPLVMDLIDRRNAGEFSAFETDIEYLIQFRRFAWWHRAVTSSDVLRQRVAFALSEIFVVSDNVDTLIVFPHSLSGYYDVLLNNSFGNFRDLLRDVSLHPAMGIYLSHINNRKANLANNTFPDENYAREVMQLFSIGLFELNIDGSLQLDANNQPIPTYSNVEIREFAKIFTGLSYGGPNAFFGNEEPNFVAQMQMFDAEHEPGEKRLLNGVVVPPGQSGSQDIEAAIDNLFNHPNVGPFIGKQLIQRLVTSNPSPAYIERVARAFNGDTTGVRGDMQAVIRAILTDPEALADPDPNGQFGKLREPVVRNVAMLRQLGATSNDGFIFNSGYVVQFLAKQHALSAPSVFNFFLPSHSPPGELAAAGLVAPEFQITTSSSIAGVTNLVDWLLVIGAVTDAPEPFSPVSLDLDEYRALVNNVDDFIDRLDIVFTAGTLSMDSRQAIAGTLEPMDDMELRLLMGLYLILVSPDYAVRL